MVGSRNLAPIVPLFVPGDRPERFDKAAQSGADAIIIDLEDAVKGDKKESARKSAVAYKNENIHIIIRINAPGTLWFENDLKAVAGSTANSIMLPKVQSLKEVEYVLGRLNSEQQIIPLVETVQGVANLMDILRPAGILCCAFGSIDYALDLNCEHTFEALALARQAIVFHSRLAGLSAPIDGVTQSITDVAQIQRDAGNAAEIGFGGKLAIHPKQIIEIAQGFSASPESIEHAREIVALSGQNGATVVDGEMVDAPVIEQAKRMLLRHKRISRIRP